MCYPEGKRQSQRLKPGVLSGAERGVGREAVRAAAGAVRAAGPGGLASVPEAGSGHPSGVEGRGGAEPVGEGRRGHGVCEVGPWEGT